MFDSLTVTYNEGGRVKDPTPNKIEDVTFGQYLTRVAIRLESRGGSRVGQAYFIELQELHSEWALQITVHSPDIDPFYNNKRIGIFLTHVCEQWVAKGGKSG